MKIWFAALMMIFTNIHLYAQKIPEHVMNACLNKFPGMTAIEWEIAKNIYKADFSHNNRYTIAAFDENGHWLETRIYIDEEDLPEMIIRDLDDQFENGSLESIMKVENNKKEFFYEIDISLSDDVHELVIDKTGKILKSEIVHGSTN